MASRDRHITRSGDDYTVAFSQLLPQGMAWPRGNSVLMQVVSGLAKIWGFVELAASKLLEQESDPRTTIDLLPDWERNWGLPDLCYSAPGSIGERQKALVQRMTLMGGQSRQFFIDAEAQIGFKIKITEFRPFMVGLDRVGDNRYLNDDNITYTDYPYMVGPPENRFYWTAHSGDPKLTWFRCGGGGGQAGIDSHLEIGVAMDLDCLLNRWKPAHTELVFDYSASVLLSPMAGTP